MQTLPPVHALGQRHPLGQLAHDDDQAHTAEVAAHHGKRHVLNQLANAQQTKRNLHQATDERHQEQGEHHSAYARALLRHLNGQRRQHRSGWCTRCRDEPLRATKGGSNQTQCSHTQHARQRTFGTKLSTKRRKDGHAKRYGRWQRHQHGGKAAPNIARQVGAGLCQLRSHHLQRLSPCDVSNSVTQRTD